MSIDNPGKDSSVNSPDPDPVEAAFAPKPKVNMPQAHRGENAFQSVSRHARDAAEAAKAAGKAAQAADDAHRNMKTETSQEAVATAMAEWRTQVSLVVEKAKASDEAANRTSDALELVKDATEKENAAVIAEQARQEAATAKQDKERVLADATAAAQEILKSAAGPKR